MSIASEITSIGENLKKDYQSIANLGADLTNVDKNIENISSLLDGVYDVLPKTEFQEGTEVTIENGLKGKIDFDDGKVGFGQASQESTNGYQLAKPYTASRSGGGITWVTKDSQISASGSTSSNEQSVRASDITNDMIISLPPDTYNISGGRSDLKLQIIKYDNGSVSQLAIDSGSGATFTLTEATNVVYRGSISAGTSLSGVVTIKVMLESGSTAHDFEQYTGGNPAPSPSYPFPIQCVTGNQDVVVSTPIEITIIENLRASTISSGNNFFYVDNNYIMRYFPIEKGKKYKVTWDYTSTETQINIYLFTENVPVVNGTYNTNDVSQINWRVADNITFIADRDGYFVTAYSRFANTIIENFGAIQYEAYQLSLGDIELNAIGNYKDELVYDVDEDKVYKANRIAKYVLAENDGWVYDGTTYNRIYNQSANFLNPPCKIPSSNDDPPNILCDYLMNYNANTFLGNNSLNGITLSQNGAISARNTSKTTLEQYKSWLSEVKPVLYYVIGTQAQTLTEITDTTLVNQVKALYNAHSNNGTTIITSNGDLPMIIKVRGLKGE